jgi:hypothetical protein
MLLWPALCLRARVEERKGRRATVLLVEAKRKEIIEIKEIRSCLG